MTEQQTPASVAERLTPGPLTAEMVPLLTPGKSRLLVVNADTYLARHNLANGALATFRSSDGRYIDVAEISERNGSVFSRFKYVGESAPASVVERLRIDRAIGLEWPQSARDTVISSNVERYEAASLIERLSAEREVLAKALDGINELARDWLALIPDDLVRGGVLGELLIDILARAALTQGESRQTGWQDIATGDLVARHIRRSAEDAGFGLPAAPAPADGGGE